jgi:hypothetical protein
MQLPDIIELHLKTVAILTKLALGPQGVYNIQNEKRSANQVQLLEPSGFGPECCTAENLGLKYKLERK